MSDYPIEITRRCFAIHGMGVTGQVFAFHGACGMMSWTGTQFRDWALVAKIGDRNTFQGVTVKRVEDFKL